MKKFFSFALACKKIPCRFGRRNDKGRNDGHQK
nr:MAG TPA: hypothetical protein [Caudoviricetes sp.]